MVTKKEKHPIQHQVGNSWQGFSIHPCHRNVQIVSPRKVSHNVQQMGSNIEPKIRIFFTLLPQGSFIAIQVKNFFKPKQIYKNTFKMYTLHTRSFLATIVNKISKTKQIYKHTSQFTQDHQLLEMSTKFTIHFTFTNTFTYST